MARQEKRTKFITQDILKSSLIGAFQKLDPRYMVKNPVMFVVEVGFAVACYEAGVSKDAVDDVTALARAYMEADEDLDLEDAIEKVVKKYPQFKKGAADPYEDEDETKGKSWGQRQNGKTPKKMSGVEKRFYELNPDLKK